MLVPHTDKRRLVKKYVGGSLVPYNRDIIKNVYTTNTHRQYARNMDNTQSGILPNLPRPAPYRLIKQSEPIHGGNIEVERVQASKAGFLDDKMQSMTVNDKPTKMVKQEADMALSDLLAKKPRRARKGKGMNLPGTGGGLYLPGTQSGTGLNLI
eukprot:Lithocolla_globosa_v1_NODE_1557_length_2488_cov_175.894369.p2 type:complete len:154 gc:universal NODE_1557_length_2488_cov_175.894369:1545-2006(+)